VSVTINGVDETVREIRKNNQLLQQNTEELEKFNKTSTILALAMIFLGVVSVVIAIVK
jgi:hypothetical protein